MFNTCNKTKLCSKAIEAISRIAETQIRYLDAFEQPANYKLLSTLIYERFGVWYHYRNVLPYYLGLLIHVCDELDLPCLSATVVRKDTGIPGRGLAPEYKTYHPECKDIENTLLSIELRDSAMSYNHWQPLLDYFDIDYRYKGFCIPYCSDNRASFDLLDLSDFKDLQF